MDRSRWWRLITKAWGWEWLDGQSHKPDDAKTGRPFWVDGKWDKEEQRVPTVGQRAHRTHVLEREAECWLFLWSAGTYFSVCVLLLGSSLVGSGQNFIALAKRLHRKYPCPTSVLTLYTSPRPSWPYFPSGGSRYELWLQESPCHASWFRFAFSLINRKTLLVK